MKELISRDSGTVGIITYLRTDSTRISEEADANGKKLILESSMAKSVCGSRKAQRKVAVRRFRMLMRQFVRRMLPAHRLCVKDSLVQRPVPPVSADLETFCCKPYEACSI